MHAFVSRQGFAVFLLAAATASTAQAGQFKTLATFTGANGATPLGPLVYDKGKIYGTAGRDGRDGYGDIFAYDIKTQQLSVILSLAGADGANPIGLLRRGNTVFFVGEAGGAGSDGVVAKLSLATGKERVVYAFSGNDDARLPYGLTEGQGVFYGVSVFKGLNAPGTIFAVDPASGMEKVLYSFANGNASPGLIYQNGVLYGSDDGDGANQDGELFSLDPASGTFKDLHDFAGAKDGSSPNPLIYANGLLYGTTAFGGANGDGTIFSIDPVKGTFKTLYAFDGAGSGSFTQAALTYDEVNGDPVLLGTNIGGGANGAGTVFEFDLATMKETTLYSFPSGGPAYSLSPLLKVGHSYYGTTADESGGDTTPGTVFRITP